MPTSRASVSSETESSSRPLVIVMGLAAIAVPALLAFRRMPSTTFFNQAAALIGWAAFLLTLARSTGWPRIGARTGLAALMVALSIGGAAALVSIVWVPLPTSLALLSFGMIAAAALTALVGAAAAHAGRADEAFHAVCVALVAAGVLSVVVSLIQVFAPGLADGEWIAPPPAEGRAGGNLRQPNHLSTLLLWSMVAATWLTETGRLARVWSALLMSAFVFGLVLASSRTGVVGVLVLSLWGLLDRGLSPQTRATLVIAPIAYLLCFGGLTLWSHTTHQVFGGEIRINEAADSPNSRWRIWMNALSLIAQNPWWGVGFGEFNFAWTLTTFPQRPTAFFDHAHNLPLQFAVELGVPLAALLLALIAWALWRAFVAGRDAAIPHAGMLRAAFLIVLVIAVHSLLEYPLWYAHFLLPTAFVFGLCLKDDFRVPDPVSPTESRPGSRVRPLLLACTLMLGGGVLSVIDYMRVVRVYMPDDDLPPLPLRIAIGQRSWFFAHHAAYAAATIHPHPSQVMPSFRVATHFVLDSRLLIAWAVALDETGDVERARYLAQRAREFRNEYSNEFFRPCNDPAPRTVPLPFQCTPPSRQFNYRDFR